MFYVLCSMFYDLCDVVCVLTLSTTSQTSQAATCPWRHLGMDSSGDPHQCPHAPPSTFSLQVFAFVALDNGTVPPIIVRQHEVRSLFTITVTLAVTINMTNTNTTPSLSGLCAALCSRPHYPAKCAGKGVSATRASLPSSLHSLLYCDNVLVCLQGRSATRQAALALMVSYLRMVSIQHTAYNIEHRTYNIEHRT